MVTIRRHPVPTDSYDPKRPLNDLLVAQLEHFKHIAKSLPLDVRNTVPAEPSIEDREGVDRFIAVVTRVHASRKKAAPRLVTKLPRRKQPVTLDLVAAVEETSAKNNPVKSDSQRKPKSKARRASDRSSKR
jgi:glycine cleavage system protein P-like pyridoxal-binding family